MLSFTVTSHLQIVFPSRTAGLRRHALPDALRPVPVRTAERRNEVEIFLDIFFIF